MGNSISDCNFYGVKWDEQAVDAVSTLAGAALENAKAIGHIAMVLQASNVHIDAMVKIGSEPTEDEKAE